MLPTAKLVIPSPQSSPRWSSHPPILAANSVQPHCRYSCRHALSHPSIRLLKGKPQIHGSPSPTVPFLYMRRILEQFLRCGALLAHSLNTNTNSIIHPPSTPFQHVMHSFRLNNLNTLARTCPTRPAAINIKCLLNSSTKHLEEIYPNSTNSQPKTRVHSIVSALLLGKNSDEW